MFIFFVAVGAPPVKTIRNGQLLETLKANAPLRREQLRFALASLRASGDLDLDPKRAACLAGDLNPQSSLNRS
ncbi:MAG: hypothetical protein RMZ43_033230 [Nostoc sp. CmiVER01]|uniref:hypothetical protein n=1 Tax=Nostoc sp. CmiVER01 TaxID=3075384 RepID=UPI002AD58035|nr:hypothetical protein [Nostoc sp. CmiVER01]MDZ8123598.1 hypothetical protein [Nostoc sp. CmiVER01]